MRDEIEVMRVLRTPPIGKLLVTVGGARLGSLSEVQDPALRQRLLAAIGELIVFAGGYSQLLEAGVAPPLEAPASARPADAPLTAEQEAFLSSLERELKATVSRGKGGAGGAASSPNIPMPLESLEEERSTINLVADIDRILQRHLAGEPLTGGPQYPPGAAARRPAAHPGRQPGLRPPAGHRGRDGAPHPAPGAGRVGVALGEFVLIREAGAAG
jgi:hypothetical protein